MNWFLNLYDIDFNNKYFVSLEKLNSESYF